MSARLDGDKKLNKALDRHIRELEKRTDAALESGGWIIANETWRRAPYISGNLRDSYQPEVEGSGMIKQLIVGTDVDYAPHQEYGTKKMAARPHLRPAFDAKEGEARKEINRALDILIKKW